MLLRFISMLLAGFLTACGTEESPKMPVSEVPSAKIAPPSLTLRPVNPSTTGCLETDVVGNLPSEGLRWQINGQVLPGQTGARLCREYFQRGDDVTVQMTMGGRVLSSSLKAANAPPRVSDVTFSADANNIKVSATAVDADGDGVELHYQWMINGEVDVLLTEAVVSRSQLQLEDKLQVRIVPNDGINDGPTYTSRVFSQPNQRPRISSRPPASFEAYEYSYQVRAKDPEGSRLNFVLENPPEGMTIGKSSGTISWPLTGVKPGKYDVKIVVRDPEGGEDSQEFVLSLGAPEGQ